MPDDIWYGGVARLEVTPKEPLWLGGFGSRDEPASGVLSEIYVRAAAFRKGSCDWTVVVAVDQLGLGREVMEEIAEGLMQRFGVKREFLVLASSHSHSTPACNRAFEAIYPPGRVDWLALERYERMLVESVYAVVAAALAEVRKVKLFFAQGTAGFGSNRRRVSRGKRHLPGPVDHDVPVLQMVDREAGTTIAIVFGYACHTTVLSSLEVSNDYAGFASEELEALFPEATCLFVAGCGADINALPRGTVQLCRGYGRQLATAVLQALNTENRVELTASVTAARLEVALPFDDVSLTERVDELLAEGNRYVKAWDERWPRAAERPKTLAYPLQCLRFGEQVSWIVLTSEVTVDYALRLKSLYGWETTWVSAYANELMGYVPSARVREEGGYEGWESIFIAALPAPFSPTLEEVIVNGVERVMDLAHPGEEC